jgi:hypothetical protein
MWIVGSVIEWRAEEGWGVIRSNRYSGRVLGAFLVFSG